MYVTIDVSLVAYTIISIERKCTICQHESSFLFWSKNIDNTYIYSNFILKS